MTSTNEKAPAIIKKDFLWWRHEFYRSRWKVWRAKWLELVSNTPAGYKGDPVAVLGNLKEIKCDPDVALRLAFLEASHKPATQSKLAKKNTRQQSIRRKLDQSRKRLLKTALELEQAASDLQLIFIKPEEIDSLRTLAEMCRHEIETLLWSHELELPPGHELFTLAAYVNACSGKPNHSLVMELLDVVYCAYGRMPPTKDAIEKHLQRFRKPGSIIPELIEDTTSQRGKSGDLRKDLLTYYPD